MLVAKQQTGGDSLVDTLFEDLHELNRMKITNELRWCIEVDNHDAEKIGDLQKNWEAIKVVKMQSSEMEWVN